MIALALLLSLVGCGSAPELANPQTVTTEDYRATFDASIDVLRDHSFVIHRQDYRFGRITAKPLRSPTAMEVWNRDNATFDQTISSTLNDQQRQVTITLSPTEPEPGQAPATTYDLIVRVDLERMSDTTRRLTGAMDGYAIVRPLSDRPDELRRANVPTRQYYFHERDPQMEQRLLRGILQRAAELKAGSADADATE